MDYGNKYIVPIPGIKILVVDCDLTSLASASKMLRILGYEVVTATLGSDALSIIEKNKLHIVLMEIHLPDMETFELIDKIRESYGIPSLIMTADGDNASIAKALSKGAKHYFIKPILISDLKGLWQFALCSTKLSILNKNQPWKPLNNNSNNNSKGKEQELAEPVVQKRRRIRWTDHLHRKFMEAVILAGHGAGPKKIHEYMNMPGITKQHVSSYLQKYRQLLKEQANQIQYQKKRLSLSTDSNLGSSQSNDLFRCEPVQFLGTPAYFPSTEIPAVHEPAFSQNQLFPGTLMQGEMNGYGVESVDFSQVESFTDGSVFDKDQLFSSADFEAMMANIEPCFTSWSQLLELQDTSYDVSSMDFTAAKKELHCSIPLDNNMCEQFPPELPFLSMPSGNVDDEIFNISEETEKVCDEDLVTWLKSL
ncbi:hypothetical protein PIB30_014935 [Stylosanthes scabra]|uniref:Response regulatory domain-containing protein n=1 Tax=Stylosanthes scabra TaxID=79078 RepID=A0ABU6W827_9FABA|nr:hypothetical protein [Stylosanthes scabra]